LKKTKAAADFTSPLFIMKLIEKWRNIVGVDPVYVINMKIGVSEDPAMSNMPAWIEGLDQENHHPAVTIFINQATLEQVESAQEILEYVIHELCHIVIWDALVMANPEYRYTGMQARATEILVMKMTSAILASSEM
jgi:hypothetical protein